MTEPTFDAHGYPTDETLEAIQHWPIADDVSRCMRDWLVFCQKCWYYPEAWTLRQASEAERDVFRLDDDERYVHYVATGGWSGNESVIDAMAQNSVFWSQVFVARVTGGGYWFKDPR